MLNYVKSEWYRITHMKDMYVFTGILSVLSVIFNVVLFLFSKMDVGFPYGTVSFSLSFLAADMTLLFLTGAIIVALFFTNNKNGVMKNAVAFGISREKIFIGKGIVSAVASLCSLVVILAAYIGSAVLLLEQGVASDAIPGLLKGIASLLVMAVAAEVLAVALFDYFENNVTGYIVWYLVISVVPKLVNLLGLRFNVLKRIASWMPANYLNNEVMINMSGWSALWDTPEGVAKCLISGGIGLLVFVLAGMRLCRRQEV
ncbi:MAG: hypothetical protein J6J42_10075 [Lachnospiraceae bacterium]|nr:hypothetical protein [Lachnospiraceae bacterium]